MPQKNRLRDLAPKWLLDIHDELYYACIKAFPKRHAASVFREYFGRPIDWTNPTILSEKGRWIQFNTDTSRWSELADKYKVREFYRSIGLGANIPKLYGVWDNAADIDFSKLPDSFVLKTNHGCGEVIVVSDKSTVNESDVKRLMQQYLKAEYGVWTAEPHYLKIKPVVLAEEMLPNTCKDSATMVDYKVFCSWGKPLFLDICYDRDPITHHANESWYTPDWVKHDEWHTGNYTPKAIKRPASLDRMFEICATISKDMPLVRIDFYDVDGKPFIGELTFTPNGYNPECITPEAQRLLGDMIELKHNK